MEARRESLLVMSCALNPGVPAGTRKPRTPSSVRAQTTATSATLPSPIQRLAPSSTQSSPSRRAEVVIAPGLLPPPRSVSPKQPISSPAARPGSQRCFCSSEPNFAIAVIASEPCTETKVRQEVSPASSS